MVKLPDGQTFDHFERFAVRLVISCQIGQIFGGTQGYLGGVQALSCQCSIIIEIPAAGNVGQ